MSKEDLKIQENKQTSPLDHIIAYCCEKTKAARGIQNESFETYQRNLESIVTPSDFALLSEENKQLMLREQSCCISYVAILISQQTMQIEQLKKEKNEMEEKIRKQAEEIDLLREQNTAMQKTTEEVKKIIATIEEDRQSEIAVENPEKNVSLVNNPHSFLSSSLLAGSSSSSQASNTTNLNCSYSVT